MTFSPMLENTLLVGGMVIGFLLIIGIAGALMGTQKASAARSMRSDPTEVDLENRLHNLGLGQAPTAKRKDATATISPLIMPPDRPKEYVGKSTSGRTPGRQEVRDVVSPRATASVAASGRLALPESGRLAVDRPAAPQPRTSVDPLAARFTAIEPPSGSAGPSRAASNRVDQPALPPTGGQAAPPAGHATTLTGGSETRATVSSGRFTEMLVEIAPPVEVSSTGPATEPRTTKGFSTPTERLPLTGDSPFARSDAPFQGTGSGTLASPVNELAGRSDSTLASLIHSEGVRRSDTFQLDQKKTTEPAGVKPLGAISFNPMLLRMEDPLELRKEEAIADTISRGASPFANESVPHTGFGGSLAPYLDPSGSVNLDATRIIEEFDIPDSGFETHVFSTAELIDNDPFNGYPGLLSHTDPSQGTTPLVIERDAVAPADGMVSPEMKTIILEIAGLPAVDAVHIVNASGAILFSQGNATLDSSAAEGIAVVLNTAMMEGQRLDLGDCSSLSVESPTAALLLLPIHGSTALVVQAGDVSRLALVRRQVRKPLAALRATSAVYDVS